MAHVLVIDDERNIRKMVRLTLERAGHTVVTAEDGAEGLILFGTGEAWDVTLTDERLPGMEGHVLLREARQRDPLARIIMMTSFATFELASQVLETGATDFLRKPFSTDLLRHTIALALERPRQLTTANQTADTHEKEPRTSAPGSTTPVSSGVEYLINGVRFWPTPLPSDAPMLPGFAVRRTFRLTDFETLRATSCVVGITPHVLQVAHQETGQEYPPTSPLWDTICRLALSNLLWEERETLPEMVPVYELTTAQLYAARQMAGMPFLMV